MITLKGPWTTGFAFDVHTIKSVHRGENEWGHAVFESTRSEMGEYIYRLKYRQDVSMIGRIVDLLQTQLEFVKFMMNVDVILPVPPSNKGRKLQPVVLIAQKLAEVFGKEFRVDVLDSTNTEQVKDIDSHEKYSTVKNSILVNDRLDKIKRILILDDLFDSGSTLSAYVMALREKGYMNVSIFALTRTRKAN